MKKIALILIIILGGLIHISCDKSNPEKNLLIIPVYSSKDQNVIGGETNIPINQVGNVITSSTVTLGNTNIAVNSSIKITKNENGIVTVKVIVDPANLLKTPSLSQFYKYYDLIPSNAKDASGKINTDLKFKVTSEGIQDFVNIDGKPHTLVKYDGNVGDTYEIKKSSGKTLTRTVVGRSDNDDFSYRSMFIKTITVEQNSRVAGIQKFRYRANHKFGIVYLEAIMEDGSTAKTFLYSQNY